MFFFFFFFSSRRRHTRWNCDWSSDVCSSDLEAAGASEIAKFEPDPTVWNIVLLTTPQAKIRLSNCAKVQSPDSGFKPELRDTNVPDPLSMKISPVFAA